MPISERTLRKWRKESLKEYEGNDLVDLLEDHEQKRERILQMTQELLDLHLLKK